MGMMKNYAKATISSNLKDDAYHHDTEKLAAVALAGDLGNLLFRVKYANDHSSYERLQADWTVIVFKKAAIRGWGKHVKPSVIARITLDHWLNDVCVVCGGKAHLPIEGVPNVLSDDPCFACAGTGTKKMDCEPVLKKQAEEMLEALNELERSAAGRAMNKLAGDMDF